MMNKGHIRSEYWALMCPVNRSEPITIIAVPTTNITNAVMIDFIGTGGSFCRNLTRKSLNDLILSIFWTYLWP